MDKSRKQKELDELIQRQIQDYNQRKAKIFFDLAVGEIIQQFGITESKQILKCYLDQLEEWV